MRMSRTEAIEALDVMFEANRYYLNVGDVESCKVPYISGPPGVGKTAFVKNYVSSLKMNLHRLSLTSLECYELKGILIPNDEKNTVDIKPLTIFPTSPCVLFIDELNAADISVQKVLLDLFHERKIMETALHPDTMLIAAGNKNTHVAEMNDLILPLQDRCKEIELYNSTNDALTYLHSISTPLYQCMSMHRNKLVDILENATPVSLRGLVCSKYILERWNSTNENKFKLALELYLGSELTDLLLDTKNDFNPLFDVESSDKYTRICAMYDIIVHNNNFTAEELSKARSSLTDDDYMTVLLHCKANNTIDQLNAFRNKINIVF